MEKKELYNAFYQFLYCQVTLVGIWGSKTQSPLSRAKCYFSRSAGKVNLPLLLCTPTCNYGLQYIIQQLAKQLTIAIGPIFQKGSTLIDTTRISEPSWARWCRQNWLHPKVFKTHAYYEVMLYLTHEIEHHDTLRHTLFLVTSETLHACVYMGSESIIQTICVHSIRLYFLRSRRVKTQK
jgi:hypothetical protein